MRPRICPNRRCVKWLSASWRTKYGAGPTGRSAELAGGWLAGGAARSACRGPSKPRIGGSNPSGRANKSSAPRSRQPLWGLPPPWRAWCRCLEWPPAASWTSDARTGASRSSPTSKRPGDRFSPRRCDKSRGAGRLFSTTGTGRSRAAVCQSPIGPWSTRPSGSRWLGSSAGWRYGRQVQAGVDPDGGIGQVAAQRWPRPIWLDEHGQRQRSARVHRQAGVIPRLSAGLGL